MKVVFKFGVFLLVFSSLLITSCNKDEVRKGCTDPEALNYDNLAKEDDGTCEYIDSSVTIWANGEAGAWGEPLTGTFFVRNCRTDSFTFVVSADTTITPADTAITPADTMITINVPPTPNDTVITPADTVITPADTAVNGDAGETYLLASSDAVGNYEVIIQLLNKRNAWDFRNGHLVFSARLHPDAVFNNGHFEVFIHGNHYDIGGVNCEPFRRSDPILIASSTLDTNSFREISIPLIDFTNRQMQDIDLVFGIRGTNAVANSPLILINSVTWIAHKEEE